MKKLRITVDGKVFDVVVETLDEQGRPTVGQPGVPAFQQTSIAPPPSSAPKPAASAVPAGAGAVTSPLAGRVVSIDCQVGQKVASGTQLATVEAMKMNTFVYAEHDGTVATIHVAPADVVEEGQVLVTLS
ncbi:MAG: biotin/lipoyl-containing protein [Terrimicrobiaceae bacterium]